jgi:hypothetical protein
VKSLPRNPAELDGLADEWPHLEVIERVGALGESDRRHRPVKEHAEPSVAEEHVAAAVDAEVDDQPVGLALLGELPNRPLEALARIACPFGDIDVSDPRAVDQAPCGDVGQPAGVGTPGTTIPSVQNRLSTGVVRNGAVERCSTVPVACLTMSIVANSCQLTIAARTSVSSNP